jgi:hypothetical protein
VGGIAISKPGGSFVTQESARVVDAQGNPVPVASLCIESVWTFTYRPYPMEAPIFNGGPISPGGAGWDVIDRGLDRYGNNVVEVDRGVCNYHQSSLTDRLLLTFTGVTFTSWSYQPRVSATTSFGTYHLDVGPAISGGVPARKALVGAASRPILVP